MKYVIIGIIALILCFAGMIYEGWRNEKDAGY